MGSPTSAADHFISHLSKILIIYIACLPLTSHLLNAQDKWLNFTASNEVKDVAFMNGFVWPATNGGLMRVDPETHQTSLKSRLS